MKKILLVVLSLTLCFAVPIMPVSADDPIIVVVDGVVLDLVAPPVVIQGAVLLPVRPIFNALGKPERSIIWNDGARTLQISMDKGPIYIRIGSRMYLRNRMTAHTMEVAPRVVGGSTMLPLSLFMIEGAGFDASWAGNVVTISTN